MAWIQLQRLEQFPEILKKSSIIPQLIFKHSTRCSISSMAMNRIESFGLQNNHSLECHYLDLIQFRELSNLVVKELHIIHQSPQAILIINKTVVYHESHGLISSSDIQELLKN
jgi:bacillithiol system protein YtxJ